MELSHCFFTLIPLFFTVLLFYFFTFTKVADIDDIIAGGGIVFRPAKKKDDNGSGKVKTKAKKKQYITGAHGSGSARQKAKYREQRANRHKK